MLYKDFSDIHFLRFTVQQPICSSELQLPTELENHSPLPYFTKSSVSFYKTVVSTIRLVMCLLINHLRTSTPLIYQDTWIAPLYFL